MNRRGFLKLCGVVAGSLCLPVMPGGTVNSVGGSCMITGASLLEIGEWLGRIMERDMCTAAAGLVQQYEPKEIAA